MNIDKIELTFNGQGDYGVHDGFFNAIATINNLEYPVQCCTTADDTIDFDDCGYNWGMCADTNEALAKIIGDDNILPLLIRAYKEYEMHGYYQAMDTCEI